MNVAEYQRILTILGYSLGRCDGQAGAKTKEAVKKFQKDNGLVADAIVGAKTTAKLKERGEAYIKNFKDSEFACKCGCKSNKQLLSSKMIAQNVRSHFGRPTTVNSGTRCAKHNKACGGVANSRHLLGKATDLVVANVSGTTLLAYTKGLVASGLARYTYRISPTGNAVHIDIP